MRKGCYDIHERVNDMNRNGVLGSMCFPSFVQFCGQLCSRTKDLDMGLNLLRAYNDWHIDEWCGTFPGRFIPLSIRRSGITAVDEVAEKAKKGCPASRLENRSSWLPGHFATTGTVLRRLRDEARHLSALAVVDAIEMLRAPIDIMII